MDDGIVSSLFDNQISLVTINHRMNRLLGFKMIWLK